MAKKALIKSEVENYAEFDIIRYAQVWEDADILLKALDINENDNVLSIASAGENAISMLIKNPKIVYAIDLNDIQIIVVKFKIACYKYLEYEECMQLLGVFECDNRIDLYKKIKTHLPKDVKDYFGHNMEYIDNGVINVGKFEHYFKLFREKVLPLVHNEKTRKELLDKKTKEERIKFYNNKWNNFRWNALFRIFFSRTIMGKLGRDKAFFRYVEVNVAEYILERTKYALTELDTSNNSYLYYIMNGCYDKVLPVAYRKENFDIIKKNIDKIIVLKESIETFIERKNIECITKYNLSDIFEYMSEEQMCNIVRKMLTKSPSKSKIAYWNMLSNKRASKYIDELEYKEKQSVELIKKDKAFFYNQFILEEVK